VHQQNQPLRHGAGLGNVHPPHRHRRGVLLLPGVRLAGADLPPPRHPHPRRRGRPLARPNPLRQLPHRASTPACRRPTPPDRRPVPLAPAPAPVNSFFHTHSYDVRRPKFPHSSHLPIAAPASAPCSPTPSRLLAIGPFLPEPGSLIHSPHSHPVDGASKLM